MKSGLLTRTILTLILLASTASQARDLCKYNNFVAEHVRGRRSALVYPAAECQLLADTAKAYIENAPSDCPAWEWAHKLVIENQNIMTSEGLGTYGIPDLDDFAQVKSNPWFLLRVSKKDYGYELKIQPTNIRAQCSSIVEIKRPVRPRAKPLSSGSH